VLGPGWQAAAAFTAFFGAPLPPHVLELLTHGRPADGATAVSALGLPTLTPTQEVLADLFSWATVTPIAAHTQAEVA
jgi:hypothetical protein